MPNYTVPNAQGLDYWIQLFNTRIYNYYLKPTLGLTDSNCMCFGRVERNHVDTNGYIPEAFVNGQYVGSDGTSTRGGLFFDAGKFVMFFSQIENKRGTKGQYVAKMELIVFADMAIITPGGITSTTQRLTEVLLDQLENWITYNGYGFKVVQTYFDIDKVLERYSGTSKRNTLTLNMSNSRNLNSFGAVKLIVEKSYNAADGENGFNKQMPVPMDITIVLYIKTSPDLTKLIPVGNGRFIYQEYGEGNTLTPLYTDTGLPFLKGKGVQLPFFLNDAPITLPNYNLSTGIWTKTGLPNGFNDGDYVAINLTNYV